MLPHKKYPADDCLGFTLTELLVCVAVVGLLAALVLAAVGSARNQADIARCSGQARTLGAAVLLYAGENRGNLPPGWNSAHQSSWGQDVAPYLELNGSVPLTRMLNCPSISDDALNPAAGLTTYKINEYLLASSPNSKSLNGGNIVARNVKTIENPVNIVLLAESIALNSDYFRAMGTSGGGQIAFRHRATPVDYPDYDTSGGVGSYGKGKANVVFADGHVRTLAPPETLITATRNPYLP